MIDSVNQLIHTSLYGEMLLALAILSAFGAKVLNKQSERVIANVKRCTYLAFGAYFAVRISRDGIAAPGTLITYSFRAFIASGLTFVFCSFTFSVIAGSWSVLGHPLFKKYRAWLADRKHEAEQLRREKEEHEQASREEEDRRIREQEFAREEAARRAREQADEDERRQAEGRIEKLRFDLYLFHNSLPIEVRNEYPLSELDRQLSQFAELKLPREEVVRRVAGIRSMLSDRANLQQGPFGSLQAIVEHFDSLRDGVSQSGLPDDQLESLLSDLEMDQARAIRELREKSCP